MEFLFRQLKKGKIYFLLLFNFSFIACYWGVVITPKDECHKINCRIFLSNYNGPYKGKVFDYETMEPMEGVDVIFWWFERYFYNNGLKFDKIVKIEKVKTNGEGEFFIKGFKFKKDICFPKFLVFKKDFIEINLYKKLFKKKDIFIFSKDCCIREDCECVFYLKKLNEEEREGLLGGIYPISIPVEILDLIKEGSYNN